MAKILLFFICFGCLSYQADKSIVRDHVTITIYPYEHEGKMAISAMPELKPNSELISYKRRFEYVLINVPEIHLPEKLEQRNEIWNLYPDTTKLKRLYLNEYVQDEKLVKYFEETFAPIENPNVEISKTFTVNELMDVASKFFYCDKVMPDTTVQSHVCIGLNGVKEASWKNDYTLLEAFCYEGIFNDLDKDSSQIWDSFVSKKKNITQKYRSNISTLDQYLEDVKLYLFERMKNDVILKQRLLEYYEMNKKNLAFKIQT